MGHFFPAANWWRGQQCLAIDKQAKVDDERERSSLGLKPKADLEAALLTAASASWFVWRQGQDTSVGLK